MYTLVDYMYACSTIHIYLYTQTSINDTLYRKKKIAESSDSVLFRCYSVALQQLTLLCKYSLGWPVVL